MADDITAQIQQAKGAGYSDDQIVSYLASKRPDLAPKISTAAKSGYKSGEIVSFLGQDDRETLQKALDYRTGNSVVDPALGVVQGAARGLISTGIEGGKIIRGALGMKQIDPQYAENLETPNGTGQGTGKFIEQTAEYAAPTAAVGGAVKGAKLVTRAGAQALTNAGVAALQTGGDPGSMAVAATLGGAGEVAGAAARGIKNALTSKAPSLANFSDSFGGATPTQKARIAKALPTLQKDGINPAANPLEMQSAIKGKLEEIGNSYDGLPADIKSRTIDPAAVIDQLKQAQQQYMRRGVVTDDASYKAIQSQIDKVGGIAAANGGKLDLEDIIHLKQKANGRTTFASPDAEHDLWRGIGNAYRSAADALAPETTPLNRDYAAYSDLEKIIDQNVERGKGTTPSGLDHLMNRYIGHAAGAAAGGAVGYEVGGTHGAELGAVLGGLGGAKLSKVTVQAFRNAIDNGALQALPIAKQRALALATKAGNNAAILRILGQSGVEASSVSPQRNISTAVMAQ